MPVPIARLTTLYVSALILLLTTWISTPPPPQPHYYYNHSQIIYYTVDLFSELHTKLYSYLHHEPIIGVCPDLSCQTIHGTPHHTVFHTVLLFLALLSLASVSANRSAHFLDRCMPSTKQAPKYKSAWRVRWMRRRSALTERHLDPTKTKPAHAGTKATQRQTRHAVTTAHPMLRILIALFFLVHSCHAVQQSAQRTLKQMGVQAVATAGAALAVGLISVNASRPGNTPPDPSHDDPPTAVQISKRLSKWTREVTALTEKLGPDHWQATSPESRADLAPLRKELLAMYAMATRVTGLTWSAGVGSSLCRATWEWECNTNEPLGLSFKVPDALHARWDGDSIAKRSPSTAADTADSTAHSTRIMFHNVRRFKSDIDGWLLRDQIWSFATEWDIDWVGLSDHWLEAPPGKAGKWDRSGVGVHQEARYRTSGVQAAAAKGYGGNGWGGPDMTWAIDQGLRGANGPVAGTLLASRSG